jgi:hypothetical protein
VVVRQQRAAVVEAPAPTAWSREMEWINQNPSVVARYAGEWVAVERDRIVAHGPELGAVLAAARQAGHAQPLVFQAWSDDEGEWLL